MPLISLFLAVISLNFSLLKQRWRLTEVFRREILQNKLFVLVNSTVFRVFFNDFTLVKCLFSKYSMFLTLIKAEVCDKQVITLGTW